MTAIRRRAMIRIELARNALAQGQGPRSTADLARALGADYGSLRKYLDGRRRLPPDGPGKVTAAKIAAAMGRPAEWLRE